MGDPSLIPFRYPGQYADDETGLHYNWFRYYDPQSGTYISQDPTGLAGGMQNLYAYVKDVTSWIDPFGLTGTYFFTDGVKSYIGKGPVGRMGDSMAERVGGRANVTKALHVDFGDDEMGLMVESWLIVKHEATTDKFFHNKYHSSGKKLLEAARTGDPGLYDRVVRIAKDFELEYKSINGIKCR